MWMAKNTNEGRIMWVEDPPPCINVLTLPCFLEDRRWATNCRNKRHICEDTLHVTAGTENLAPEAVRE